MQRALVHAAQKGRHAAVVVVQAHLLLQRGHLLEVRLAQWRHIRVVDLLEARPHREVHLVEVVVQDVVALLVELLLRLVVDGGDQQRRVRVQAAAEPRLHAVQHVLDGLLEDAREQHRGLLVVER